ncbi:MAG TPA: c-type cytochrome domain-containing protein, partial [Verrucomicrobiota bacterium]|nr:c-type cytochrome domain-containing protein [Verrucomicrobiota bacterium]
MRTLISILFCLSVSLAIGTEKITSFAVSPKVVELLESYCFSCHDAESKKGDVRLDNLETLALKDRLDLLNRVQEQIFIKEMPPKKKKTQPSDTERQQLYDWMSAELRKHNASKFEEKLRYPSYGNLVPHDKLFDPKVTAQAPKIAASPARIWRTLPQSYEQKQETWLGARGVGVARKVGQSGKFGYLPAPFGLHTKNELKNYSFDYTLAGAQTEGLANNARALLKLVIKANPGPR